MEKELHLLQSKLLEILIFFHNFCEENGLTYYALGGTMLGAVRHKGFIPWDDDIDVGMPRADFEKLTSFQDVYEGKYVFETVAAAGKESKYPFTKLYDTTTTLIENIRNPIKRGIYLDVFPLDGLGRNEKEAKKNFWPIRFSYNLLTLRNTLINNERSALKNAVLSVAQFVPDSIMGNEKLIKKIDAQCKNYQFKEDYWGGNLVSVWGIKDIMPLSYYGKPTLYDFETVRIYGPEKFEEYLTCVYGDWRKLPPEEERMSHHDYYLNLEESYLQY